MEFRLLIALCIVAVVGAFAASYLYGLAGQGDNIHNIIEKASYCSEDAECVFIGKPCNIVGCGIAVNENEAAQVNFMVNIYNFPKGAPPCVLACNKSIRLACINSRCAVV